MPPGGHQLESPAKTWKLDVGGWGLPWKTNNVFKKVSVIISDIYERRFLMVCSFLVPWFSWWNAHLQGISGNGTWFILVPMDFPIEAHPFSNPNLRCAFTGTNQGNETGSCQPCAPGRWRNVSATGTNKRTFNYSTISVNQEKTGSALFACGSTCLMLFIYNVFSLRQTSVHLYQALCLVRYLKQAMLICIG